MVPDDARRLGIHPITTVPTLAGCIDYADGVDLTHHQTRFVYEVDKKGPDGNPTIDFTAAGGDIPISNVILNLNPVLAGNPD